MATSAGTGIGGAVALAACARLPDIFRRSCCVCLCVTNWKKSRHMSSNTSHAPGGSPAGGAAAAEAGVTRGAAETGVTRRAVMLPLLSACISWYMSRGERQPTASQGLTWQLNALPSAPPPPRPPPPPPPRSCDKKPRSRRSASRSPPANDCAVATTRAPPPPFGMPTPAAAQSMPSCVSVGSSPGGTSAPAGGPRRAAGAGSGRRTFALARRLRNSA
eukprot:322783-Chlamydomonas_euryale.AAC.7